MKKRIIFIDNKDITDGFAKYVEDKVDWLEAISEFENDRKNLKKIIKTVPDIIVCNSIYPIFTDFMQIEDISKLKKETQIFIVSGNCDTLTIKNSYKFGVKKYMFKPININMIFNEIKNSI